MRWAVLALIVWLLTGCDSCRTPAESKSVSSSKSQAQAVVQPQPGVAGVLYRVDPQRSSLEILPAGSAMHVPIFHKSLSGVMRVRDKKIDSLTIEADLRLLQGGGSVEELHQDTRLDSGAYPMGHFEGTYVNDQTTAAESHQIGGVMTLRGRSVEVSFPAEIKLTDTEITCEGETFIDLGRFGARASERMAYRVKGVVVFTRAQP